jgi:methylmalonyl-CoA mutase, N-terminal domain
MALCRCDEAYTIPTEKAARITLHTMQIEAEEIGVCDTVDPLGGSWAVETLTNQMEGKIVDAMGEVERWGGIVNAISEGHLQAHVSRRAFEREKALRSGEMCRVGLNRYRVEEEEPEVELHPYRPELVERARERLETLRRERSTEAVERSLDAVRAAAASGDNIMPAVMDAVTAHATVGEVMAALKAELGEFREPVRF